MIISIANSLCVKQDTAEPSLDTGIPDSDSKRISFGDDSTKKGSFSSKSSEKSPKIADKFEPVDIEGQSETGIWIHHPGSDVAQVWEPRKGKSSHHLNRPTSGQNDSSSTDESMDPTASHSTNPIRRGLRKIGSVFRRSLKNEGKSDISPDPEPSPRDNIRALNAKKVGVRLIIDDTLISSSSKGDEKELPEETGPGSPRQGHVKDVAKSILKQAGKSARDLKHTLSRKASKKSNKDATLEEDSSEDESLTSSLDTPRGENGLIIIPGSAVPNSALVSSGDSLKSDGVDGTAKGSGNNSFKSDSNNHQEVKGQ